MLEQSMIDTVKQIIFSNYDDLKNNPSSDVSVFTEERYNQLVYAVSSIILDGDVSEKQQCYYYLFIGHNHASRTQEDRNVYGVFITKLRKLCPDECAAVDNNYNEGPYDEERENPHRSFGFS